MSALFNLNLYTRAVLLFMLRHSFLKIYIFININQITCMTLSIQLRANQFKLTWCHNEFYWSKLNYEFGKTKAILITTDFTSIVNNVRKKMQNLISTKLPKTYQEEATYVEFVSSGHGFQTYVRVPLAMVNRWLTISTIRKVLYQEFRSFVIREFCESSSRIETVINKCFIWIY